MIARHKAREGQGRGATGAIGQRPFLNVATSEVARARRYGSPLSCLVIDVETVRWGGGHDGHALRRATLEHVIAVCRAVLRAADYIGRVGEEFVIMLPETPLLSALGAAERILADLAASTGEKAHHHPAASISIGVAEYDDQTRSLDQLLKVARSAMIAARRNGGNQAICYLDDVQLGSDVVKAN